MVHVCAWCMCVHGACVCMVRVRAWCMCLHDACVCTSMCAKEEYQHTICTLYAHYMHTICTLYAHYIHTICTLYAHYMHTIYSEVKQLSQNIDHWGMHYTCDHEVTSPSRVTVPVNTLYPHSESVLTPSDPPTTLEPCFQFMNMSCVMLACSKSIVLGGKISLNSENKRC